MQKMWRYWSLIALLVLGNVAVYGIRRSTVKINSSIDANSIPLVIGDWHGEIRDMAEGKCVNLGAEVQICREYTDEQGNSVWLVLVYSRNRRAIQLPERLYQAYGYNIVATDRVNLSTDSFNAKLLTVEKGNERETVLYILTDGKHLTHNLLVQQVSGIWNRLIGRERGWALIRVFASSGDINDGEVNVLLRGFMELLIPEVIKALSPDDGISIKCLSKK